MDVTSRISLARGFSYIELIIALSMGAFLVMALSGVVGLALETQDAAHARSNLTRQAQEAMQRLTWAVSHSRHLMLPLNDNPQTNWSEHVREETLPPTPPTDDSSRYSGVLCVTLPAAVDLDLDGTPDADNDGDGLLDEDIGADNNFDGAPGVLGVDDNGDGYIDDSDDPVPSHDNDEDDSDTEDILNGLDDDADGSIDEDLLSDNNNDGNSGLIGVDDDQDGFIDENNKNDDDEDGQVDEDWYDSMVFYLDSGVLKERIPVPWDSNNDTVISGADFVINTLAVYVTRFRVARIPQDEQRYQVVDLTLELTNPRTGEVVRLQTLTRVGGAL
jgi:type II secretory pathway pseudopilin PulG